MSFTEHAYTANKRVKKKNGSSVSKVAPADFLCGWRVICLTNGYIMTHMYDM